MKTEIRYNFQGALVLSKMNDSGTRLLVKTYMGYSRKHALAMFKSYCKEQNNKNIST
jgi:hypothetical protein